VGRWAGVVAAGFMALSPFTIHYAVEARPYAVLMFCSALSVLLLLVALERNGTGWWGAWGLSLAAVLYTHYTGFAVVGAQVAWALWARPAARRELLLGAALAAIAFMPWLPYVKGERLNVYEQIVSTLGITYPDAAISWLMGMPFVRPGDVPGWLAIALLFGGLATAAVLAPLPRFPDLRSPSALVALLAVATPLAVLAYSLLFHELFRFPRNLIASLPFAGLLIGWVLARPGWPRAAMPLVLATAGLAIGTVKGEQDRWSRPDFPEAADYIDAEAGPGDRVVYSGAGLDGYSLAQALRPYLSERHRSAFTDDPKRWAGSPRVVVVTAGPTGEPAPALRAPPGLAKVDERELPGLSSLRVALYRAER
jgi:mannosyltransferase